MARAATHQTISTPEEPANPTFSPERALEAIGERWSFIIFREALTHNTTKFADFEQRLSLAPDILGARLDAFIGAGLMDECPPDQDDYCLTDKGRNMGPVISALSEWADGWDDPLTEAPTRLELAVPPRARNVAAQATAGTGLIATQQAQIEIVLLDGFAVTLNGVEVPPLPVGSQRLLAFLALRDRAITRVAMAGTMWPEADEERAGTSLRSALSRLDRVTHDAVVSASAGLSLTGAVIVDFREAQALAHRLLSSVPPADKRDLDPRATEALSAELLPGWYDEWVATEAEDWRQLRVGALEAQAGLLLAAGRFADSANAARAAMKVDPLRESATCCLVRAHLAKGNQSEALRALDLYSELLQTSLGLRPTEKLTSLVDDIAG
jgi:DNA-binding SARP family transcriptional activator/DNA-binding HxlR family transcriptional regulator